MMFVATEFLTFTEQCNLLRTRGLTVDDDALHILAREGYYPIINGYKDPFIDHQRSSDIGDDRYVDGTSFDNIYDLFLFDRSLRELSFHYISQAESAIKTACAYVFAHAHLENDAYIVAENYISKDDYYNPDLYEKKRLNLIQKLQRRSGKSHQPYVQHYRDNYGVVPLWILVNALTFGEISYFFDFLQPHEQNDVCRLISEATKRNEFIPPSKMRSALSLIVSARNICAHSGRLYCTHLGYSRRSSHYSDLVQALSLFLNEREFNTFDDAIGELFREICTKLPQITDHLEKSMGYNSSL